MNMWMKNTSVLKKIFPEFYSRVVSPEYNCPNLNIIDYKEQNLVLQKDNCHCFLHSIYDTDRELQKMFEDIDDPEQILIIFGLGMGHCLDYIRRQGIKYQRILVLEPYNNIFNEMIKRRDLEPLLKMRDVSINLFYNPLEVITYIMGNVMSSRKVKFLYHLSYRSVFMDIYQEINRLFANEKNAFLLSAATIDYFLRDWTQNQIKSLNSKHQSSIMFNDQFAGVPAIIVAAGPSLENRLAELKEIQDRALIIAPGSGAKICNNKDIKAHMALAMDSDMEEVDLFHDSKIDILVGSYRLNPKIEEVFPNTLLRMIISNESLAQYYHEHYELPVNIVSDHASVSSSAVDFAVKLGCNPIILVGQDMCYYGNRMHADEEEDTLSEVIRAGFRESRDINGEPVYTSSAFIALQRDMELLNQAYEGTNKLINATEAGLGIPGVENMRFRDVIDRFVAPADVNVTEIISRVLNAESDNNPYDTINSQEFFQHVLDELANLERINLEKLKELEKLQSMIKRGLKDNRLNSQLYFIREKNDELQRSQFYQVVIAPIISRFLVFYQAGTLYSFNGNPEDPVAWLFYESKAYELSNRYISMIKEMLLRETGQMGDEPVYLQGSNDDGTLTISFNSETSRD